MFTMNKKTGTNRNRIVCKRKELKITVSQRNFLCDQLRNPALFGLSQGKWAGLKSRVKPFRTPVNHLLYTPNTQNTFVGEFFQAEDGIRDWSVTGVQTCALPI